MQARSRSIENFKEHPTVNRRRQSAAHLHAPYQKALNYDSQHFVDRTNIGQMDNVCVCGAHKFKGETPSMCCSKQQVCLDLFPPLPWKANIVA